MIVKFKGTVIPLSVNAIDEHTACCYWFDGNVLHKEDFNYSDLLVLREEVKVHALLANDLVKLKSGSPIMQIEQIEFRKNKPHANCFWKADNNHYVKSFNLLVLEKIED